eukprot:gene33459-44808_t
MEFFVLFKSGDSVWLPYSQDIFHMVQFEEFCNSTPGLYFLQYSHSVAETRKKLVNKQPITTLQPGETIYVELRTWGEGCGRSRDGRRSLLACSDGVRFMVSSTFSTMLVNWGPWRELEAGMVVLTAEMLDLYPFLRQ